MDKPLVSIITPCYNGEKTIGRLIESVIAQTYRPIEFIIIDDGSTDSTNMVIVGYKKKLQDAGIKFIYHYQNNKGLGGAINSGLKLFKGEYFCLSDADDYLESTSVKDRVEAFRTHPECAVVTSDAYIRNSDTIHKVKGLVSKNSNLRNNTPKQFELLLNGDSIFCTGCHLIDTKKFLDVNPNKSIYPARRGQNWQLLLPLYYKYDRFFLDKPLYNYINYPNSMSKDKNNLNDKIRRYNEHEKILINTLKMIENVQCVDLSYYKKQVKKTYTSYKMVSAMKYNDKKEFNRQYNVMKKMGVSLKDRLKFIIVNVDILNNLYQKLSH